MRAVASIFHHSEGSIQHTLRVRSAPLSHAHHTHAGATPRPRQLAADVNTHPLARRSYKLSFQATLWATLTSVRSTSNKQTSRPTPPVIPHPATSTRPIPSSL